VNTRLILVLAALASLHASTALGIWNYERPADTTPALMGCWSNETVSYAVGFNGAAFRNANGTWTDITDTTLTDSTLFAVHGTTSGAVYAAGYRLGTPRFDSNDDGQVNADDSPSHYGVIFRYNGSAWEELNIQDTTDPTFHVSSFSGIWADENDLLYFSGGSQHFRNDESPAGVLLSYDGASFKHLDDFKLPVDSEPLADSEPPDDSEYKWPHFNAIWGTGSSAYISASSGLILELDIDSGELSPMDSGGYDIDFRGVWRDTDGTLYAVAGATYGYIFRYHNATKKWQPMGIDKGEVQPLTCIAGNEELLVAAGSYGKAYYLDKSQKIWKEMLTGTQNNINCLSVARDGLLSATNSTTESTGALYRMTKKDPNTAYILADPPTGIGAWLDGTLTHQVTLYDFALGDIWKREWRFNNGTHHDPVPAYGVLYSSTPEGATTALYITGEGGRESNRELRISNCNGCTPHVDISEKVIRLAIRSGYTTQSEIKARLEESPAVSEVYARHGDSPWVISSKEYDSIFLSGGRDDEDLYINEATSGDDYYLASHRFKDRGTWEPSLTVYRENVTYLDGMIKIFGHRTIGDGTTIVIQDAGDTMSESAQGVLGGIIDITAVPGEKGNFKIQLLSPTSTDEVTSIFSSEYNTLYVGIHTGTTTIQAIIDHLNTLDKTIETASFKTDNENVDDSENPWQETYEDAVTLEGGTTHAIGTYDEATDTVTLTIDSGITTTTDIARGLSDVKKIPGDNESRLFEGVLDVIGHTVWNTDDRTNTATLPGITKETATTTVRVFDQSDLSFTHTPGEAKLTANVTLTDTSNPNLDIAKWEWAVFRAVGDGYKTKANVTSETGTAEVAVSDLGKYDIGMQATLKDGSSLNMVKKDALNIKGKHAGDSSMEGSNGCFIGTSSP